MISLQAGAEDVELPTSSAPVSFCAFVGRTAHGPQPAIVGLDDELRSIDPENLQARMEAYRRSRLSVTEFGKAVLAHREDFTAHNPIDRWWGGTHLTNANLWRWNPVLIRP